MSKNFLETSNMNPGFLFVFSIYVFFSDSESFDIEISPNNVDRNIPFHVSGTKMVQINCVIQGKALP